MPLTARELAIKASLGKTTGAVIPLLAYAADIPTASLQVPVSSFHLPLSLLPQHPSQGRALTQTCSSPPHSNLPMQLHAEESNAALYSQPAALCSEQIQSARGAAKAETNQPLSTTQGHDGV